MIAGKTISRFTKSWPASVFRQVIRDQFYGYDDPQVVWGTLKVPAASSVRGPDGTPPQTVDIFVRLRIATKNLPKATVRKINNNVQYSSHVVNLRVDDFSNPRLTSDSQDFAIVKAARLFYQHFRDVYDGLSFAMQRYVLAPDYAAFHQMVRNQVSGIGRPLFNNAPTYGSGGKLKAFEIYRASHIATNSTSIHEAMHQWADYFGLAKMAGYTPGGTSRRAPFPARKLCGGRPPRMPSPIKQHPLHLYAMGKGNADAVPNLVVFENQTKFGSSVAAPDPKTMLSGASRVVTINDIIAMHGPRIGPRQNVWRRATIVISVGKLLTQQEMNYYNFFAKRVGQRINTTSYEGHGSFFQASRKKMRLRTDIDARGPKVTGGGQSTFRNHSPMDWRGIVFDKPVPSRFVRNKPYTFARRACHADGTGVQSDSGTLGKADGTSIPTVGSINGGRFSVTTRFPMKGNWVVRVNLFYPGSGPQHHVTGLTGIIVT